MIVRLLVSVGAAACLALAWPAAARADVFKLDTSQFYGSLQIDYADLQPMHLVDLSEGVYEIQQPSTISPSYFEFTQSSYPLQFFSQKAGSISGYSVRSSFNGPLNTVPGPSLIAPAGSQIIFDFNRGSIGVAYISDNSSRTEPIFLNAYGTVWFHGFRKDGSRFDIRPDSTGRLIAPEDCYAIGFTNVLDNPASAPTSSYSWFIPVPNFYIVLPDEAADAIRDQTDQMMSTDGSDSIVDSVTSGGEDGLLDRLGFVGTAISVPNSILQGMTSTADSSIQFPGISLPQFEFEIPATTVDVWEYCPELETPCKLICTGVCIFLWLNGVKHLYDRITGKEQEVSIDTDA